MTPARPSLTVGVLGGMGPEATLDFLARVVTLTPAATDQDHVHMIVDNRPQVPNRNEAIAGTGPSPAPLLAAMAQGLERCGADFLVMPCNTAHAFQDSITAAVDIPFVSMIDETVEAAIQQAPGAARVGLLATTGTIESQLYQHAFEARQVETIVPGGRSLQQFMKLLYRVKAGDKAPALKLELLDLTLELCAEGAGALVAGCTEVPLLLGQADVPCAFINSNEALATATVALALGERRLPRNP